jgi:nitrogen-specific signal transduction histidine kinase
VTSLQNRIISLLDQLRTIELSRGGATEKAISCRQVLDRVLPLIEEAFASSLADSKSMLCSLAT